MRRDGRGGLEIEGSDGKWDGDRGEGEKRVWRDWSCDGVMGLEKVGVNGLMGISKAVSRDETFDGLCLYCTSGQRVKSKSVKSKP